MVADYREAGVLIDVTMEAYPLRMAMLDYGELLVTTLRHHQKCFSVEAKDGKLLPYFLLGLVATLLAALLAVHVFDVPFRGSWSVLLLLSGSFLVPALGQGLLISTLAPMTSSRIAISQRSSRSPRSLWIPASSRSRIGSSIEYGMQM